MDAYKIVYSFDDSGIWYTFFETYDALFFNLVWNDVQVYCKKYIQLIQSKKEVPLEDIADDALIYTVGNEIKEVSMVDLWFILNPKVGHPSTNHYQRIYIKEIKPSGDKKEDSMHQSRICEYII